MEKELCGGVKYTRKGFNKFIKSIFPYITSISLRKDGDRRI